MTVTIYGHRQRQKLAQIQYITVLSTQNMRLPSASFPLPLPTSEIHITEGILYYVVVVVNTKKQGLASTATKPSEIPVILDNEISTFL